MFNLLSRSHKKIIQNEYKLRLAILIIFGLFFSVIVAGLLLIPSLISAKNTHDGDVEKNKSISNFSENQNLAADDQNQKQSQTGSVNIESMLKAFNTLGEKVPPSQYITSIAGGVVGGVSLNHIAYVKSSTNSLPTLEVSGVATDRESLVSLGKSIDSIGTFDVVHLPVSSLAQEKDVQFNISLSVSKK